jgi:hypothetical protein
LLLLPTLGRVQVTLIWICAASASAASPLSYPRMTPAQGFHYVLLTCGEALGPPAAAAAAVL